MQEKLQAVFLTDTQQHLGPFHPGFQKCQLLREQLLSLQPVFFKKAIHDCFIKITAAQMVIPADGPYFHDIIKSLDNGNVQCSSTEIHNERKHILFRLLDVLG